MIQEEVNHRSVAVMVSASKLSAKTLAKALRAVLRKQREISRKHVKTERKSVDLKPGKITIAELSSKSKDGLQKIPIDDGNIGAFEPIARKYGITYALTKDESESPPKWAVFFRAKDSEVLNVAFAEFTKRVLSKENDKPSVVQPIRERAEERVNHRERDKERELGEPEL